MKKKLPLILKRIMLFALVFSLTLSTSVSASGVGDHDNSGQSGATAGSDTSSTSWSTSQQGLMIYIVDNNFNVVSTAQLILYSDIPSNTTFVNYSRNGSTFTYGVNGMDLSEFKSKTGSDSIPYWKDNGENWKVWWLGGSSSGLGTTTTVKSDGTTVGTQYTPSNTSSGGSSVSVKPSEHVPCICNTLAKSSSYNLTPTMSASSVISNIDLAEFNSARDLVAAMNSAYATGSAYVTATYSKYSACYAATGVTSVTWGNYSAYNTYVRYSSRYNSVTLAAAIWMYNNPSYVDYFGDAAIRNLRTKLSALTASTGTGTGTGTGTSTGLTYLASTETATTVTAAVTTENTEPTVIELDDNTVLISDLGSVATASDGTSGSPAYTFLDNKDIWNMEYLGYASALEALSQEPRQYFCVVEGVTWTKIVNGSKQIVSNQYVLGTMNGLAYYWSTYYGGSGTSTGGWYNNIFNSLFNSLTVGETLGDLFINGTLQTAVTGSLSKSTMASYLANCQSGGSYGMHIYTASGASVDSTSTCDEPNADNPQAPPDDHDPNETNTKDEDGNEIYGRNIVKFYVDYEPDPDSKVNFYREDVAGTIVIEDEIDYNEYELIDWYTSDTYKKPSSSDDDYYTYKSSMTNIQTGTDETTVYLGTGETTLYLLLVKDGGTNTPGTTTATAKWNIAESQLTKRVNTTTGESGSDLSKVIVKIDFGTLTACPGHSITVHYYHDHYEDDTYGFREDGSWGITDYGAGWVTDYDYSETYTAVYCKYSSSDNLITLKLKPKSLDSTYIATKFVSSTYGTTGYQMDVGTKTATRVITSDNGRTFAGDEIASNNLTGYKMTFVIHRASHNTPYIVDTSLLDSTITKTTLTYLSASSNEKTALAEKFTTSKVAKLPSKTVVNETVKKSLSLTFVADSGTDFTTSITRVKGDIPYNGDDVSSTSDYGTLHSPVTATAKLGDSGTSSVGGTITSITGDLTIETYFGTKNGGTLNTDINGSIQTFDHTLGYTSSNYDNVSGVMVSSGYTYSFLPYIMMRYDGIDSSVTDETILVYGQYVRQIKPNDYAEICWKSSSSANLKVDSTQWSVHASAIGLAATNTNVDGHVLPGGAIYTLDTRGTNQTVLVRTYQTILDGNGLVQASITNEVPAEATEANAILEHSAFVSSVVNGLENLSLVQWVDEDSTASDAFGGSEVYAGGTFAGQTLSSDTKYYLRDDESNGKSSGSNESDLDANAGTTTSVLYTFGSDENGNIWMTTNGSNKTIILTKNQDETNLDRTTTAGRIAYDIDQRTYVVRKLVDAIERNTGNDTGATWAKNSSGAYDGKWYNEINCGISVLVQTTEIEVGLQYPAYRSTILDTKLQPTRTSKASAFSNAYICTYKTNTYSNAYVTAGVIGEFKGVEVTMVNMDKLFYSNSFLIPDVSVSDID